MSDRRNVTMLCSMLILKILLCAIFAAKVSNSQNELLVAFSQRQPFVFRNQGHHQLKGLDILIVENFSKKFHLQIKYIEFNSSLNEMFNDEQSMGNILLNKHLQ